MVTAFVLIDVERGRLAEVADRLATTDGVAEVHSVAGRYDLVAIVRVSSNEAMAADAPSPASTQPSRHTMRTGSASAGSPTMT